MHESNNDSDRLVRVPEAAERLGVSIKTVRNWIFRRQIECVRIRGTVSIRESTIHRLIEDGTTKVGAR